MESSVMYSSSNQFPNHDQSLNNPKNDQSQKIKTVSIHDKKFIENLRKMTKYWEEHAHTRGYIGENCIPQSELDKRKIQQLVDSAKIISCIKKELKHNPEKVYVARDGENKIQGIALASFKKTNQLKLIATNPDNLPILGYEKTVIRGTGTALIAHIFKKILKSKTGNKNLHLEALPSSISFYEKIGFKHENTQEGTNGKKPMVIQPLAMQAFINKLSPNITIEKKEPKPSELKYDRREFKREFRSCREAVHISDPVTV